MPAKLPQIELVTWQDIASHFGGGWFPAEGVGKLETATCYSVGWVVHENRKYITLVADRSYLAGGESYGHDTVIPKAVIINRRVLKCPAIKAPKPD